jgi:hypothetical protein
MQQMKTDRKIAVLLPDAVFIVILAFFATQTISAQDPGRLHEIPYSPTLRPTSGQTTTYFAFSFQKLKEAVPALKGLKYDESQERLPSILAGVAQTIANVLPNCRIWCRGKISPASRHREIRRPQAGYQTHSPGAGSSDT